MDLTEIIILAVIVVAFAIFMLVKSKNKPAEANNQPDVKEMPSAVPAPQNAPIIQAGIDDETIAAIMAAISMLTDSGSGAKYTVRSINRAKSERPAWCFAGMQQNTRPF